MLDNKKPKRQVSCQRRVERPVAAGIDESWSMYFMNDEPFDGCRIRFLTTVNNSTHEGLAINAAAGAKGEAVVEVLQRLMARRRLPETIPRTVPTVLWAGVHLQAAGPMGLPERSGTGLQPAGETNGQRVHRGFQRAIPAGMPERELVPVPSGCRGESGDLAKTLRWGKASQRPWKPVPAGVCRVGNNG